MKRFNTFGEYMFDLLFAPLKKGRRTVNQFAIFFRVIGREFDDLKGMIFRVRNEANVASASEVMLPVHGQDRDMPRLMGETVEAYRTRLSMKGIISEWSGTRRGILYALAALGYEQAHIEPVGPQDPEHWAEFIVDLGVGNAKAVRNIPQIYHEIQRVKEGSSKLASLIINLPTAHGQFPITPRLGPRQGQAGPPVFHPGTVTAAMYITPHMRSNFSTVTLPMASRRMSLWAIAYT